MRRYDSFIEIRSTGFFCRLFEFLNLQSSCFLDWRMTVGCHQIWKIHNRKRDDIRSSGHAWPGETLDSAEPCRPVPQTISSSSLTSKSRCSFILHMSILLLIFGERRKASVMALQLPDIYWNSSNPIFRIDNTDHILDVNKNPAEYDRVNIYCPRIARISSTSITESDSIYHYNKNQPAKDGYYIIYNVSKEEYETCRITNPQARRMLVCDNPNRLSYVTITFRPFTPQPNGPEFHAGNDYYFIATSTGTEAGLDNKIGGRCLSHNMKLLFKVAGKDAPDNDDATDRSRPILPLETAFRLPNPEQLPAYGRVDETPFVPIPQATMKPFFRWKTTSATYRPKIMKYTPLQPPKEANVINTENNELPGSDARPSETNDINRFEPKSTTSEEEAAVPGSARQTKTRANNEATSKCQNWISMLILTAAIQRMFQNV